VRQQRRRGYRVRFLLLSLLLQITVMLETWRQLRCVWIWEWIRSLKMSLC